MLMFKKVGGPVVILVLSLMWAGAVIAGPNGSYTLPAARPTIHTPGTLGDVKEKLQELISMMEGCRAEKNCNELLEGTLDAERLQELLAGVSERLGDVSVVGPRGSKFPKDQGEVGLEDPINRGDVSLNVLRQREGVIDKPDLPVVPIDTGGINYRRR